MSKNKLNRILKKHEHQRDKQFTNMSDAQKILIFIHGETLQELYDYSKIIEAQLFGKELIIVGFVKKISKEERSVPPPVCLNKLITKKELNIWNNPKKKDIEWIRLLNTDILINLDLTSANVFNILTAASSAKIKCGCKSKYYNIFDLIIDIHTNATKEFLLEQILFYLNAIQVKN